jgi:hypothetical protein
MAVGKREAIGIKGWALVAVSLILMVSIGVAWNTLISSSIWLFYNPGSVNCSEEFAALPYLVMILSILILKLLRRNVNGETLTYLYLVSIFSSYMAVGYGAFRIPLGLFSQRWINPTTVSPLIPELLAPRVEIVKQLVNGGVPIPWVDWLPTLMYWWLLFSFFGIYMVSMGTIWSRPWIQVEQIPFPQTLAVYEVYEQASTKKSLKPYFVGIVLGFVFQFIIFLTMIFPWFPDVYGWRVNTTCYGAGWITSDSALYSIIGLAMFNKNPSLAALFYMAPLGTLQSSLIFILFFFVATQIAFYAGYYTDAMSLPGCGRAECSSGFIFAPPFRWMIVANQGGGLGLVSMYLFLQRKHLAEVLRSVLGGGQDKDQRFLRIALMSTVVSYVIIVILLSIGGLGLPSALLMPVMVWVLFFAAIFVFGRTGYNAIGLGGYGMYWLRVIWPQLPQTPDTNFAMTAMLQRQSGSDGLSLGWGGSLVSTFATYKFGNLTNTNFKNLYYAMIFAVILIPIVWWMTLLPIAYSQGFANLPFYQSTVLVSDISYAQDPSYLETRTGSAYVPYILAGLLVVWTLSILHARFATFPLDPYGFLLTFASRSFSEGIWTMVLAAWALKLATLRMGGSKAYEKWGVPIATGFLMGYAISILIGGILSAVRFFIPF